MSPNRAIFFDIDDTLIALKSMFEFQKYYFAHAPEHASDDPSQLMEQFRQSLARAVPDGRREDLNRAFYRSFSGRPVAIVESLALDWFKTLGPDPWIKEPSELLENRRARGDLIVGVSGSSHEILGGINRQLSFDYLLAVQLEQHQGVFTGELLPPQTIGLGKQVAIEGLASRVGIDLSHSAACGDHLSDLPMLEMVGEPFVVQGDPELEAIAQRRGWPVLPRLTVVDHEMHV